MVETHISWVFLTDRYAYKLKKPVKFDFLDFSTPELRQAACEEEVRLNRRMAPDVYLDVVPITLDPRKKLRIEGTGSPVDWVVKMRRLRADRTLKRLIATRTLREDDLQLLSRYLSEYYQKLPPVAFSADKHLEALLKNIRSNEHDLRGQLSSQYQAALQRVSSAQLRFVRTQSKLLESRVLEGRIVDGHGDLRPEHIFLQPQPLVIDCIEFSSSLRQIDTVDELCFLAMECQRIGSKRTGDGILESYLKASGDHVPQALLHFYKCYRACVRAKVVAFQAAQQSEDQEKTLNREFHSYLGWADHHAARLGRPSLIVVSGLMGTGKTTLAKELSEAIDAGVWHTDQLRQETLGPSESSVGYAEGNYQPHLRARVYEELFRRAAEGLDHGRNVVLDGSFLSHEHCRRARAVAEEHGGIPLFVRCECLKRVALSRIGERQQGGEDHSEARAELYDAQVAAAEPLPSEYAQVAVDTTQPLFCQTEMVFNRLHDQLSQ